MKRWTQVVGVSALALAVPSVAQAQIPSRQEVSSYRICHDGILSDDVGQGCTSDGPYLSADRDICDDGILSDDVGQGCMNDGPYLSSMTYHPYHHHYRYRLYASEATVASPVYHHHYYHHYRHHYYTPESSSRSSSGYVSGGSGLASCIVNRESGGNPQDVSGAYSGIANWSQEAWAEDGGTRYASSPTGASREEQMSVLTSALASGKAGQWQPYDGC